MEHTPEQVQYLESCRKMLIGKTIHGAIYSQHALDEEDDSGDEAPIPLYEADQPDHDMIEGFLYLKADTLAYRFSWVVSQLDYGLEIFEIKKTAIKNKEEQQWDVSGEEKWKKVLGKKIKDLEISWEKSWSTNLFSARPYDIVFPHTYYISTENDCCLVISAGIYDDGDTKPFIEHLAIRIMTKPS